MQVLKSKNSGFCFGVKRALDTAYKLNTGEKPIFVLGEIIHNDIVNDKLRTEGITTIEKLDDKRIKAGDTLIIRTHGEPKSTFDTANSLGYDVIDCTCPFVKEIQKIVKEHHENGYSVVIIGNAKHPEVIGINGWCDNTAIITDNADTINSINTEKLCIVVQTTFSEEKFDEIVKKIDRERIKTVDIFKTICYTTTKRQKEAEQVSKVSEAVIVIGGAKSNNTKELFDICRANCENTFKITDPNQFDYSLIKKFYKVGIVFGASTPIEQFQEVIRKMEEETKANVETLEMAEEAEKAPETQVPVEEKKTEAPKNVSKEKEYTMESAFKNMKTYNFHDGQIVHATISSIGETGITVSIGGKSDISISKEDLLNDLNDDNYKTNSEIRLMVTGKNPLKLSEKKMAKVLKEEAEIEEIKNGKVFELTIKNTNKGGLLGELGSYEVFIPSSEIRFGFVKDLTAYVGKTLKLKANSVENRRHRRQIVASAKVILEEERAAKEAIRKQKEDEFFANVQEGDIILGTPVRFKPFGAFIDVNGFDCLANISDLSWFNIKDCSEVLEIGKQYEFKVLKLDSETKRVSVGYKQLQPKPWDIFIENHNIGDVVKGTVVKIVKIGAFVEIEKGVDGLVHVSQITNKWLDNPEKALQEGQEVEAKIIAINPEKEQLSLSIKALLPEEPEQEEESKPSKSKKQKPVEEEEELHSWKDEDNSASLSELTK